MANEYRGEVSFDHDGKQYTLRLSIDEICSLESQTGMGVMKIGQLIADPERWSMTFARTALFVALRPNHPNITLVECGDIVQRFGLIESMDSIARALKYAFPDPDGEGEKRPTKAAGNGRNSSKSTSRAGSTRIHSGE